MKHYNSFLIRCWSVGHSEPGEQEVYAVEHFQTGERTRSESLEDVKQWITAACRCSRAQRFASRLMQAGEGGEPL